MVKLKEISDYLIVALCGSVSAFIIKHYAFGGIKAIAYPALAASLTYLCLTTTVSFFKTDPYVRSLMDDRAKYEGNWIQQYNKDDNTYYGLIRIKYLYDNDKYSLHGSAVDEMGATHATWNSYILECYPHLNEMHCLYKASVHGHEFTGFSSYTFSLDGKRYNDGIGYFIDMEPLKCYNFISLKFDNIYSEEVSDLTSVERRQEIIKSCKPHLEALKCSTMKSERS